MYPFFEIYPGFHIYTFGLSLSISFFVFLYILKRNAHKFWYDFSFFTSNIIWYFLSIFFFSRLFFVISIWYDMKFLDNPLDFFIMNDFNFSLFWAIFWFFLVYSILIKIEKRSFDRYIDGVVLSFIAVLVIGFIGSYFWWQVYGRDTQFGIEVLYNKHSFTTVPYQIPIFPLPLVYAFFSFLLLILLYSVQLFIHIRWFIAYLGLIAFSSMVLIGDFFSGKKDIFSFYTIFTFSQFCALILIIFSAYQFYKLIKNTLKSKDIQTILHHNEL